MAAALHATSGGIDGERQRLVAGGFDRCRHRFGVVRAQRDHRSAAAAAGEFGARRAGAARHVDHLFELRRGQLQRVEQAVVQVHQFAEFGQVAGAERIDAGEREAVDLVEDRLVARRLALPRGAHLRDVVGGQALFAGNADDDRQRNFRRQRREARPRRVAVQQHLAIRRNRVVDAGRRAVRRFLALERERVDALGRQIEPEAQVQRPHDGDGQRRRTAEPHRARNVREHFDVDRAIVERQFAQQHRENAGHALLDVPRPLMRCSTPQRGISSRTPSAASSTRTSTASGIGAAMAWRPYTTACSPSRITLPFATLRGSEPGCGGSRATFSVRTSSCAFHTLISPDSISASTTLSNRCSGTPAVVATLRACSVMWPCWMPSVDSARSAAKFCARPTAAMIEASSRASGEPSRR